MNWGHHQALSKCAISLTHDCPQCDLLGSRKQNWDLLPCTTILEPAVWDVSSAPGLNRAGNILYLPAVSSRHFPSSPCILQGLGRVTQVTVEQRFPGSKLGSCSLGGCVSVLFAESMRINSSYIWLCGRGTWVTWHSGGFAYFCGM